MERITKRNGKYILSNLKILNVNDLHSAETGCLI